MTTDQLLSKMASVLCFGGQWHARAQGSSKFHSAPTARDAMLLALGLVDLNEDNGDLF